MSTRDISHLCVVWLNHTNYFENTWCMYIKIWIKNSVGAKMLVQLYLPIAIYVEWSLVEFPFCIYFVLVFYLSGRYDNDLVLLKWADAISNTSKNTGRDDDDMDRKLSRLLPSFDVHTERITTNCTNSHSNRGEYSCLVLKILFLRWEWMFLHVF